MSEADGEVSKVHHDETDVAFALDRVTQDGRGDAKPAPGDFEGYAMEDAVKED